MKTSLLVAVSAASLMWSVAATAQSPSPAPSAIELNTQIKSRLGSASSRTTGSEAVVYQDYLINLQQGQPLSIDLKSEDFDAYIEIYRDGSTTGRPLAFDDDGAGAGTDAKLRYVPETAGAYVIRARTLYGVEGGAFELRTSEITPRDYPKGSAVVQGQTTTGVLSESSPLDEDGKHYEPYVWSARADERIALVLESTDFDPLLSIGQIREGYFVELARNDDDPRGARGLNSYLVFKAEADGDYYIQAKAVGDVKEGSYRLIAEAPPKAAEVKAINFDQTVEGRLSDESGMGNDGSPADQWRFRGQAGQRIVATLSSGDFDTLVTLYKGNENLASDDDGGGDLNSRLIHVLPEDGEYILEARGVAQSTGLYELDLKVLPPAPLPQQIQFGQTLSGELKANSAVDDDGFFYGGYIFEGRKNQRVQVTVRSGDFDAMTEIGLVPKDGEAFDVLENDDDGLRQGTDSRLNFTLPEDGQYEIHALGLAPDSKGLYSVELVDRGPEPGPGSLLVPSVARGSLLEQGSLNAEGSLYAAYNLTVSANDKLRFTAISADFDSIVEIGEMKGEDWRQLEMDDDSLSDKHARLDWTAPRGGTYQVRVRSYRPEMTGAYSLIVERQP